MLWFNDMEDALRCKSEEYKILLVVVEGPDTEMTQHLESCVNSLDTKSFPHLIATLVKHNTEFFHYFTAIYNTLKFPCVVFIGRSGVPLKVVMTASSPERTYSRVLNAARCCHKVALDDLVDLDRSTATRRGTEVLGRDVDLQETVNEGQEGPVQRPMNTESRVRIQFRMADGSTRNEIFRCDDTVLELRTYVQDHVQPRYRFDLATVHPVRTLPAESFETLKALGLYPSSVILVLPIRETGSILSFNRITDVFWFIMYPFVYMFSSIRNWVFPSSPRETAGRQGTESNALTEQEQRTRQQRRLNNYPYGNVHTLANTRNDEDDDQNTWNGNSTQQM